MNLPYTNNCKTFSQDCTAKVPFNNPESVSQEAYLALQQVSHCGRLLRGECLKPCQPLNVDGTYDVDFDHILPTKAGGANHDSNIQLLCRNVNRSKQEHFEPYYQQPSFFDKSINQFDPSNLRRNQRERGYDLVVSKEYYHSKFADFGKLTKYWLLLAWVVGAGKTVGMAGILTGINEAINGNNENPYKPRVKRVLWLVHQRSLVESIANEFRDDPFKYGVWKHKPKIAVITKPEDWGAHIRADAVFACVQSLWDKKTDFNPSLEQWRSRILRSFEVIVVDECHFAVDQYDDIFALAPHALKFLLTATPFNPTDDGNIEYLSQKPGYRDRYRLFSVFDYESGRSQGILKYLPKWEDGFKRGIYKSVSAGNSQALRHGEVVNGEYNTINPLNLPRVNAVLNEAVASAKEITDYPAHIMVRAGNSKMEAIQYFKQLKEWSAKDKFFKAVCLISSSSPDFNSEYKISDPRHPWMKVKYFESKNGEVLIPVDEDFHRILLCVDMGQTGLNNPYCSIVAWPSVQKSLIELVQRIGRALRIIQWLDISLQTVTLVFTDTMKDYVQKAVEYLHNMESEILTHFNTLDIDDDATDEAISDQEDRKLQLKERAEIAKMYGKHLDYPYLPCDEETVVDHMVKTFPQSERNEAGFVNAVSKYLEKIKTVEGRRKIFGIPRTSEITPIELIYGELPRDSFTDEEILNFLNNSSSYSESLKNKFRKQLFERNEVIIELLTEQKRNQILAFHSVHGDDYIPPIAIAGTGPKGVKEAEARKIFEKTYTSELQDALEDICLPETKQLFHKAVNEAIAATFGLKGFQESLIEPFKGQLSYALTNKEVRKLIIKRAKAYVIHIALKKKACGESPYADLDLSAYRVFEAEAELITQAIWDAKSIASLGGNS